MVKAKNRQFNFQAICHTLLKGLSSRQKEILEKRFGLNPRQRQHTGRRGERMTLEAIGKEYGLTRERVRQIEEGGLKQIKERAGETLESPIQYFEDCLGASGFLKREDALILELGQPKFKNQILFLLTLGDKFKKFPESGSFYAFWQVSPYSIRTAQKAINNFIQYLEKKGRPVALNQYVKENPLALSPRILSSYIGISKKIMRNAEGLYGLPSWPEINPRGVRDRAYLALKEVEKPLHWTEVARSISPTRSSQTVHNELIRDPRFVLVGRGIYALKEWGYEPGVVREVIFNILKKKSLSKEEIMKEVLKQRLVKENTILLNLNNKKYFRGDFGGKYKIREA